MTTQTITVTNSIPLPKELLGKWKNQEVMIQVLNDTIIVKRLAPPAWNALLPKLRKASKGVSQKIVLDAVAWARKNS